MREYTSAALSPSVGRDLLWQPQDTAPPPPPACSNAPREAHTWPMSSASCWGWTANSPCMRPAWGRPGERSQDGGESRAHILPMVPRKRPRELLGCLPAPPAEPGQSVCSSQGLLENPPGQPGAASQRDLEHRSW